MDEHRWNQIQELFHAAADVPADERKAWLASECRDDTDLANEVQSLLDAETRGDAIDALANDWLGSVAPAAHGPSLIGERVGPYRVIKEIGAGGMAVVYLAARDDNQFERHVALKVMKRGHGDGADLLRRFLVERQVLARMAHPNVAHLYDGGVLPDGSPYFVMEYVKGDPLDKDCDNRNLGVEARIDLVLEVAAAVEHAHRNLVVHRDLKPSNILVTDDGQPRLLDFGIAKVMAEHDDDPDAQTRPHALRATPEYSAPEQLIGATVTTATDVYGLAAVLYELLVGCRVHDLGNATPGTAEQVVCNQEVRRPSEAAADSTRAKQLRGDLDVILMKALNKDPLRRYPTVSEFADDLRRHRTGHPVVARPDSKAYRVGRFLKRHRRGSLLAAVALVAVLAGVAGTLWQADNARTQARVAAAERDRAQVEASRAKTVTDFMVSMFEGADPYFSGGDTLDVFDLLNEGRLRLDDELADDPDARAALLLAMGNVYANLGDYALADSLLDGSLALVRELSQPAPAFEADVLTARALLSGLNGDHDDSLAHHRAALVLRRDALGTDSRPVAATLTSLGVELLYSGQADSSLGYLREADSIRRRLPDVPPLERAGGLSNLASATQAVGDLAGADSLFSVTAVIFREHAPPGSPTFAGLMNNWGILSYNRERYSDAVEHLTESVASYEESLGTDHPHTINARGNLNAVQAKLEADVE
jgi:serine/threonine-protein kinase